RDRDTLERRFAIWFPELDAALDTAARLLPSSEDEARIEATLGVLQAVQELTELIASGPLRRSADAVELLERLLFERGMNLPEYQRLLTRYPERFRAAVELVRAACTRQ